MALTYALSPGCLRPLAPRACLDLARQPCSSPRLAWVAQVTVSKPRIPVISNVDAKTHSDPEVIKSILTKQVTAPVQWETIMKGLVDGGLEKGYELGPGKVLAGIMKRVDKTKVIENVEV